MSGRVVGAYAEGTVAVPAEGKLAQAGAFGVEIADLHSKLTHSSVLFCTSEYGAFGEMRWLALYDSAAAVDAAARRDRQGPGTTARSSTPLAVCSSRGSPDARWRAESPDTGAPNRLTLACPAPPNAAVQDRQSLSTIPGGCIAAVVLALSALQRAALQRAPGRNRTCDRPLRS